MKNSPCAKFLTPMMPKISESPEAIRAYIDPRSIP